jgi:hypothetical protein
MIRQRPLRGSLVPVARSRSSQRRGPAGCDGGARGALGRRPPSLRRSACVRRSSRTREGRCRRLSGRGWPRPSAIAGRTGVHRSSRETAREGLPRREAWLRRRNAGTRTLARRFTLGSVRSRSAGATRLGRAGRLRLRRRSAAPTLRRSAPIDGAAGGPTPKGAPRTGSAS